jgi:nucleotide-binding universal stress UspA family protein
MFKHILFPTDGSQLSRKALATALALAKALGARISAIHVIEPYMPPVTDLAWVYPDPWSPEDYEKAATKASSVFLAQAMAEAKNAGVACETQSVIAGAPWDAIVKTATKRRCDLIVMASHGRRGFASMLLGSETQKVLTHASIPVLVCR